MSYTQRYTDSAPSNNPWAAHMQPRRTSSSQQDYYEPSAPPLQSQPPEGPPPAYQEIVPETSLLARPHPPTDSKRSHGETKALSGEPASSSRQVRSPSISSDDDILQQALEFTHHAPPAYASRTRLLKPVAIPQVASGPGMPFSRGYAPALAEHGISIDEFVEFVDNLNIVSSSSPPLQVLDLAGGIVGFIPFHYAQVVSLGISAVAKVGNVALMKTRGSRFLQQANSDFFNPRGLKVELATAEAVRAKVGLAPESRITAPIDQCTGMSAIERKMAGLQGYVAPIMFNVPPPNAPTNALNKLCAKQQAMTIRKKDREAQKDRTEYSKKSGEIDEKLSKEARKGEEELQKLDRKRQKEERKRDDELRKVYKKERKESKRAEEERKVLKDFEKEMRKLDEDSAKVYEKYGDEKAKGEKDRKKEDKEGKKADKVLWILIESL